MTENCPRDGKRLDHAGYCRHCGTTYPQTPVEPMNQAEARDLVREVRRRPPFSPKCRGRLHRSCVMSGCGCFCHDKETS